MTVVLWFFLLVLIIFSAIFSSSETALSSVNRIRIQNSAENGDKKAGKVLHLYRHYNRALTGILIGNNIVNIAASSIGTVIFTSYFGGAGAGISTIVLTVLILIFGEVMPKTYAKENAEKVALRFSGFTSGIVFIFTPFIYFFDWLKRLMERFTHHRTQEPFVTEQELKVIIDEIEDQGVLEGNEGNLVRSALDFDETTAEQAMTPRVDMVSIEKEAEIAQVLEIFMTQHFSRLPVYDKEIDNVIGVLREKDFFRAYLQNEPFTIAQLVQKTLFVPPQIKISELLKRIQALKTHMAIVIDQYGGVEGLITLEDIFEELVGEIYDEYDVIKRDFQKISSNTYRVNADIGVEDLFEQLEYHPKKFESESNTVGGFALENFEKLPKEGDSFTFEELEITVSQMKQKRICWLTVVWQKPINHQNPQ